MSQANHYIDNKEFYEEFKQFKENPRNIERVERGERPVIPNSIAEKILLICNNLSRKHNFYSYRFKEEMIGDAVETCIRYIWNFDTEKYTNPFAYFTNVAYYAFVRRITKEKKQVQKKVRYVQNLCVMDADFQNNIFGDGDVDQGVKNDIYDSFQKYFDYDLGEDKKEKAPKVEKDSFEEFWSQE